MRDDFSALCGITEEELLTQLKPDIERMAEANDETYEEACLHLKRQYDGYHFSKACADIYNPFSLFNAFNSKEYKNYWFSTGIAYFPDKIFCAMQTSMCVRWKVLRLPMSSLMRLRNR